MPKLPHLTPKEVIKILGKYGFILDHSSGSHRVYYHPEKRRRVIVPFHAKDIPKGTLVSILKQAGISREDLGTNTLIFKNRGKNGKNNAYFNCRR